MTDCPEECCFVSCMREEGLPLNGGPYIWRHTPEYTGTLAAHSGHVPRMVSHVERSGSKKGDSGAIDLLFVRTDLWALSLSYRLVHESTARGMLSNRHRESPVKHLIYGLSSM